jgi:hypothetical protein
LIPHQVTRAFSVLSTIEFYDQSPFATDKVNNVPTDRLLTDEFLPVDRTRSQFIPEAQLGTC